MQFTVRPRRSLVAPLAAAALSACAAPALAAPTPGGGSIGDSLYPTLGNTGYSALHYNVDLSFGANPTDAFSGSISLIGRAGKDLSSLSVDYSGTTVGNVTVDGAPARFTIGGDKLVVVPKKAIAKDAKFTVRFGGFSAKASAAAPGDNPFPGSSVALATGANGLFTAGQTQYAHSWFPSNDTPADKASYTFTLTTPANRVAVANGVLVSKQKLGGRLRWTYQMQQPMATELIQMAVGDYSIIERGKVGGVQIRDVVANTPATQEIGKKFAVEKSQLSYMVAKVGPYPFAAYGSLSTDAPLGFALETQTLSIFDPVIFDPTWEYYSEGYWKATMLHELSHQWFGDSVAPRDWADIWLNEGHATWYETTWAAENGYLLDDTFVSDDFDELNRVYYSLGDQFRADYGPVGRPLSGSDDDVFSNQAYLGGQLVLYALRQKIGKAKFERLEREWVATYRNGNARTGDYIRLASKVSGQDLTKFLKDWIYGTKTPPMPGHPDWTVDPVTTTATSRVASASVPATAGMRADRHRR